MRARPAFGRLTAAGLVASIAVVGCTENPVSRAAKGAWDQGERVAGKMLESVGLGRHSTTAGKAQEQTGQQARE